MLGFRSWGRLLRSPQHGHGGTNKVPSWVLLGALNTLRLSIVPLNMAAATMSSGIASAIGRLSGTAGAGARLVALPRSLQRQGSLRQPQQLQQRWWQQQVAAASAPRRRSVTLAVAAPVAAGPAAPTSEYAKEMEAAVAAVRLASRLCQASRARAECRRTCLCQPNLS